MRCHFQFWHHALRVKLDTDPRDVMRFFTPRMIVRGESELRVCFHKFTDTVKEIVTVVAHYVLSHMHGTGVVVTVFFAFNIRVDMFMMGATTGRCQNLYPFHVPVLG
jgi:hypothetical protein